MAESKTRLQEETEFLRGLLDDTIQEQVGAEQLTAIEELRRLAQERRVGLPGAEERLVDRIRLLNEGELHWSIRALSMFFDLANTAEDRQRVRVVRQREQDASPHPRAESVGAAIAQLQQKGLSSHEVQQLLDALQIDLVFTAHPTEAKRRTVRELLRRVRQNLKETDQPNLLPRERERLVEQIRSELTAFWQTDLVRPRRPGVIDEVERGLFFAQGLWEIVPQLYRDLRRALNRFYPGHQFRLPRFLRFGSWIGGDRDGHPDVTAGITAETLGMLRRTAVEQHLVRCRDLMNLLVMSRQQIGVAESLQKQVDEAVERWPGLQPHLETISENEVYRRWLKVIEFRLERTRSATLEGTENSGDGPAWEDASYNRATELEHDLRLIGESLQANRGERIVAGRLQEWIDLLQTFGLHLAALEVRQDSRVHLEVLTEVLRSLEVTEDYAALDEEQKQELLNQLINESPPLPREALSEQTDDTISLFRLLVETVRKFGLETIGGHVISMTHHASDVLAVLWLWTAAWKENTGDEPVPCLPVIPLFETIDDLHRAAQVLENILSDNTYTRYIKGDGNPKQIVMVGYSDSTKDGGYLAASWGLHQAQEQLAAVAARHAVRLVVFHGRGGALGRGGGPAARAILSLPPKSVGGALRMTEQGEVLAERYDDPQIATRHLEQVTWATMLVSSEAIGEEAPVSEEGRWTKVLEQMAEDSYESYRQLVSDPGFLGYFDQATPISEIERFPIGSRPSRRRERRSLGDLRAIPWTFAWTQCRQIIPAWFGLGTAVRSFLEKSGEEWSFLEEMYDRFRLFQAIIDNAELALAKADLGIAHRYAEFARDHDSGERIWETINYEYQLTRSAVLMITRRAELLGGTAWLRRSIQERNPYVDPLSLIQIDLIRRVREMAEEADEQDIVRLRTLIRLTIQGVAAGLRTTG